MARPAKRSFLSTICGFLPLATAPLENVRSQSAKQANQFPERVCSPTASTTERNRLGAILGAPSKVSNERILPFLVESLGGWNPPNWGVQVRGLLCPLYVETSQTVWGLTLGRTRRTRDEGRCPTILRRRRPSKKGAFAKRLRNSELMKSILQRRLAASLSKRRSAAAAPCGGRIRRCRRRTSCTELGHGNEQRPKA